MSALPTSRVWPLVRNDLRLQFRYGIYFAYAFVIAFYIAVLTQAADFLPGWVPAMIIYTDPSVVGFFFLGALMMLEKAEFTRSALAMTPITAADYFWSKCITLTGLATLSVGILSPFLHEGANIPLLMIVAALTSIHFIGIGVPAAMWFKTVTSYLIGAAGWLIPLMGPSFIALMDPMPSWAMLIPWASQFKLVLVATGAHAVPGWQVWAMLAIVTLTAIAGVLIGLRSLKKEFGST